MEPTGFRTLLRSLPNGPFTPQIISSLGVAIINERTGEVERFEPNSPELLEPLKDRLLRHKSIIPAGGKRAVLGEQKPKERTAEPPRIIDPNLLTLTNLDKADFMALSKFYEMHKDEGPSLKAVTHQTMLEWVANYLMGKYKPFTEPAKIAVDNNGVKAGETEPLKAEETAPVAEEPQDTEVPTPAAIRRLTIPDLQALAVKHEIELPLDANRGQMIAVVVEKLHPNEG